MKKTLLFASILFYHFAGAQRTNQCGIIIPPRTAQSNFQSVYEAKEYINTMLDSINWKENFLLQEQNGINNAYATIIRNQRYIIYDNTFLESLDGYAGTKWASISVLAHEMGHHYRNHVIDRQGSTPAKEIEQIASPQASATHPGKADRLNAIAKGWAYAQGLTNTAPGTPTNPVPQPQQNPPPASADASWIYLSLYGNNDMTVYLSDDGRKFSEAPLKPTQPFVFKFEVYNYGWLRFGNDSRSRTYKLQHGKDYAIIWSRRTNSWTVIEVP